MESQLVPHLCGETYSHTLPLNLRLVLLNQFPILLLLPCPLHLCLLPPFPLHLQYYRLLCSLPYYLLLIIFLILVVTLLHLPAFVLKLMMGLRGEGIRD